MRRYGDELGERTPFPQASMLAIGVRCGILSTRAAERAYATASNGDPNITCDSGALRGHSQSYALSLKEVVRLASELAAPRLANPLVASGARERTG